MDKLFKYLSQNHFLTAILVVIVGWFILEIKTILIALFIAYIVMAALSSFTDILKRKKFPNSLAVTIPFVGSLILLVLIIIPLIPFLLSQLQSLFINFPQYVDKASRFAGIQVDSSVLNSLITSDIDSIGKNALSFTTKVFGGIFSMLAVIVLSFYLLIDRDRLHKSLSSIFSKNSQEKAQNVMLFIEEKLGAWVRGQIVLSFSIGIATWIGLTLLGLPSALPLAVLAGILEIVPTIGPIISSIPAIIIALSISPTMALLVIILYIIIQLLENNVLVPKIMEKAVGLNPIIIILGVMIGSNILGVLGALLAVPFISTLVILYRSLK